jgi:ribonucleotide monophosphatase NagD (HAD superfamily)
VSYLDSLDPRYRLILCDVWGVVHDGVNLYPGAESRLAWWRGEGRCVVLITNAPRTADAVEQQLARIGLPRDSYDFVATSGEAGIEALSALADPVGFVGTVGDREILEGRGVRIADSVDFTDLAMHCLNPDRVVVRGGVPEACAGAIADLYEGLGGRVTWYGKPHEAIYRHALHRAGDPPVNEVLAIGDGLQTDVLGAARMGFDTIFVTGGISAGKPFPTDFASQNGLGDWEPVAVVDSLA